MGQPAAKRDDRITASHQHEVLAPSGPPPVPTPFEFSAPITGELATDVFIRGEPVALKDSTGTCPPHVPGPPGSTFVTAPSHTGVIVDGSATVTINGRAVARAGDGATACGQGGGLVVATGSVYVG